MFALQSFCHKVVVELFEVKPKKKKKIQKKKNKNFQKVILRFMKTNMNYGYSLFLSDS